MLFGSSGIRQKFDRSLVDIALSVGSVLGEQFPECIVGTDTRTTSPLLAKAVISGILSAFDVDAVMVERTHERARERGIGIQLPF